MKQFFLFVLVFLGSTSYSQHTNLLLGRAYSSDFNKEIYLSAENFYTSFKPVLMSDFLFQTDSVFKKYYPAKYKKWFLRKAFNEHFFVLEGDNYKVLASPIINFSKGKELIDAKKIFLATTSPSVRTETEIGIRCD